MMIKEGALNAMMSGSGPTVFGIFEEKATARKAADAIRDARLTKQVYVTNIHNSKEKKMKEPKFNVTMNEYLPLRDVVFNTLRQAILRGELKPGERLMEIQLANKLGVSVHRSVRRLESWSWKVW